MAKSSDQINILHDDSIRIIEGLPSGQNIRDVLVPLKERQYSSFSSFPPRFGLGPSFRSYPENLTPIFLFHSNLTSPYQRKQMNLGEWDNFTSSVT
jgi:hypothetical protein